VKNPDGSNASDAIVVLTIQRGQAVSAPLSMLVTPADGGFFHVNLSDLRVLNDPSHYFEYSRQGSLLTVQAVNASGSGLVRLDSSDPRLRAANPDATLVVELRAEEQTPVVVVRQPTPTPIPEVPPPDSSGAWVGIGTTALMAIGILVIAILFVWRR
jgi:hypothetical protein